MGKFGSPQDVKFFNQILNESGLTIEAVRAGTPEHDEILARTIEDLGRRADELLDLADRDEFDGLSKVVAELSTELCLTIEESWKAYTTMMVVIGEAYRLGRESAK